MKTRSRISKKQLQIHIDELIALAGTVTSDMEAVVETPGVEGQHAWLKIYVPDEVEEQVDEMISQRAHGIFIDTGCDIAALVSEKTQGAPA